MSFAFPPSRRIRQSLIFNQAFRNKGLTNKWFTIHTLDSKQKFARLGMVISKRTIPKSVSRNFAKRLIRELFRKNFSQLPPLDFVIRIRRQLPKNSSLEAREALLDLILNANIL